MEENPNLVAECNGFVLIERGKQGEWRNLKLTHPIGFKDAGRYRKRNWWLAWNGERLACSRDTALLAQHQPSIYAWVVATLQCRLSDPR
jgi:hypothetical protein